MLSRRLFILLALSLSACGRHPVPASYENDAGEAAIRHVIATLPPLNPGVSKNYSIVLGEITADGLMTPASDVFTARFADLKLKFVNALNLKAVEPGPIIVDNAERLATFVLQLRELKTKGDGQWSAEVGWSYKQEFERKTLKLEKKDGKIVVTP